MIKMIVFVFAFLPAMTGNLPTTDAAACSCGNVTNIQKTVSDGAVAYTWGSVPGANQYKVWYVRKSDNSSSPYYFTSTNSFNFTGLSAGQYSFHFVTVCSGEESNIGIEDMTLD